MRPIRSALLPSLLALSLLLAACGDDPTVTPTVTGPAETCMNGLGDCRISRPEVSGPGGGVAAASPHATATSVITRLPKSFRTPPIPSAA